ncbi:MAG: hypothetical protein JXJ20_04205 [Anaerolineae bacterium]|nr:hypothetical protein [Anaerolineae bacterium]
MRRFSSIVQSIVLLFSSADDGQAGSPAPPAAPGSGGPPHKPLPPYARWLLFLAVVAISLVALIFAPAPLSTILFWLLIIGTMLAVVVAGALRISTSRELRDRHVSRFRRLWHQAKATLSTAADALLMGLVALVSILERAWNVPKALLRYVSARMKPVTDRLLKHVPHERVSSWLAAAQNQLKQAVASKPGPPPIGPDIPDAEKPIPPLLLHIELILLILVAVLAAKDFANLDATRQLPGYEGEWLTSSGHYVALSVRQYGYIPLWQPLLETGEPLIDNPFSFVLHPFSFYPCLLWGGINGIKISVILMTVLAGLGGWALGRVLGFGSLGRVLLGLLLIGKGNMHAMIGAGYYQLGISQAYFPWIIAGIIGILRLRHRRWPVVLTAIAFTLMFWAGNIWYMLPMLISVGVVTLAHIFDRRFTVDRVALRRLVLAGALTMCLSAATLLPIWINQDYIGGHPNEPDAGKAVDRMRVIEQFINGDYELYEKQLAPGSPHFYYSFVSPLWFILLVMVLFPPGWPFRYPAMLRLWIVGFVLIIFFTMWGAGGSAIMIWLYDHVPLMAQWRFVGRALAVSSFWLAVLLAMRLDSLWHYITSPERRQGLRTVLAWGMRVGQAGLALLLIGVSLIAARQVILQWYTFSGVENVNAVDYQCLEWLRTVRPNEELSVYRHGYDIVTAFLETNIRLYNIEADYFPLAEPSTTGTYDLTATLPEYGIAWNNDQRTWLTSNNFSVVEASPAPYDEYNCLYENKNAYSYAFTASESVLSAKGYVPTPESTVPVTTIKTHLPDRIVLWVRSESNPIVVAVQERAYPGWEVRVDGKKAKLQSVGGLIGVILPAEGYSNWHTIRFTYRPVWFFRGSVLTMLTAVFCAVYLLDTNRTTIRYWSRLRSRLRVLGQRLRRSTGSASPDDSAQTGTQEGR